MRWNFSLPFAVALLFSFCNAIAAMGQPRCFQRGIIYLACVPNAITMWMFAFALAFLPLWVYCSAADWALVRVLRQHYTDWRSCTLSTVALTVFGSIGLCGFVFVVAALFN